MFPQKLISCILSCIIFLLLVIVHVGAGWMAYMSTTRPFYAGLWLLCSGEKCSTLKVKEAKIDSIRSLMVAALFTCILAVLCSAEWSDFVKTPTDFSLQLPISFQLLVAPILNIITGIFVLAAVVMFEISMMHSKTKLPSKQWAFYTSCAICILSFLTGIYGLIVYKFSLWETQKLASQVAPE